MTIPKEFINEVRSNNILGIHVMLKNSLLVDKSFNQFDNMISYAEGNYISIWDLDNGKFKRVDKSLWNEKLLNSELVKLVDNFTKERVDYIKSIIRYVYPNSCTNSIYSNYKSLTRENVKSEKANIGKTKSSSSINRSGIRENIVSEKTDIGTSKKTSSFSERVRNFKIPKEFINEVKSKNILGIHVMLKNSLLVDKTFDQFDDMISYVEGNHISIWDSDNGKFKRVEKTLWNEKLLNSELVKLVDNFTKERIDYIKSIIRYIYPNSYDRKQYYEYNNSKKIGSSKSNSTFDDIELIERDYIKASENHDVNKMKEILDGTSEKMRKQLEFRLKSKFKNKSDLLIRFISTIGSPIGKLGADVLKNIIPGRK